MQDANFNVTAVTNSSGAVQERYLYTPYGETIVLDADFSLDSDGISDIANTMAYTGRQFDAESGLYHYRFRHYHAQLGLFIGRDPISYWGGDFNLYRYVHNAPTHFTDPFGLTEGIPIPGGGTIHIDGETMGTATPHVQYGVAPNQTKIRLPANMTDVDDLKTLEGVNKSLMKKLLKNPSIRQKLQNQLRNARGKCGLVGIVLTVGLAIPAVAQAGQEGGLPGAAAATGNIATDAALGYAGTVVVGGVIMGGASAAGTSVVTLSGTTAVGIGGAATVGGVAVLAAGGGYLVGDLIGSTTVGNQTIHEHLGDGLFHLCPRCWNW